MANYGLGGGGLADFGQAQQRQALNALGQVADAEARRNMANQANKVAEKAGQKQLGGTAGAMIGMSVGGPWGAVIGGVLGSMAPDLF
jgi:hypothetical protein